MGIKTEANGTKVVIFGTGDILMNDTRDGNSDIYNGICFVQMDQPRIIDETTEEFKGKKMSELNAQVHFIFEKKKSLKALISSLTDIYDRMPFDDEDGI